MSMLFPVSQTQHLSSLPALAQLVDEEQQPCPCIQSSSVHVERPSHAFASACKGLRTVLAALPVCFVALAFDVDL